MKLWGKNRETVLIKKARAVRAIYSGETGSTQSQEVSIDLITEDGEKLELRVPPLVVKKLIGEMTDAYNAINPPLSYRHNYQSEWGNDQ
jgi:hypothetical protein